MIKHLLRLSLHHSTSFPIFLRQQILQQQEEVSTFQTFGNCLLDVLVCPEKLYQYLYLLQIHTTHWYLEGILVYQLLTQ
jgi:hypothetical protein